MKLILAAAATAFLAFAPAPSMAGAPGPLGVAQPPAEWAQSRVVVRRDRIVRPGSRVIVRTVRRPARVQRCRVERQRIIRPNGRVVVRTVRTCR